MSNEYPKELALGNIVRLHNPYKPSLNITSVDKKQREAIQTLLAIKYDEEWPVSFHAQLELWSRWKGFTHGIIVEHIGKNAFNDLRVSLHLYDPELGLLYLGPNEIPVYVDSCETEFTLWKVAVKTGYLPEPSELELAQARVK